jgi:hypothetical protein
MSRVRRAKWVGQVVVSFCVSRILRAGGGGPGGITKLIGAPDGSCDSGSITVTHG